MNQGDDIFVYGGWFHLLCGRYRPVALNTWRKVSDDGTWAVLHPSSHSDVCIFLEIGPYPLDAPPHADGTKWAIRPVSRAWVSSTSSDTSSTKSSDSGDPSGTTYNQSKDVPIGHGVVTHSHERARHPTETHYWYLQMDLEQSGKQWELSYDFSVSYGVVGPRELGPREPGKDIFMDGLKVLFGENASLPELPMDEGRHEFYECLERDRLVVVKGGTGTGKSSRLPLYVLAQNKEARIIVTQPRRLGAKRLAEQVNRLTSVGSKERRVAGYRVGGDKSDNSGAPIQFVTVDYLLVRIIHNPGCLKEFTHIMLDEMHERGSEAEFLFMIIRTRMSTQEMKHIKLILTSATLQDTFLDYFNPLLGRPVTINNPMPVITVQAQSAWSVEELFYDDLITEGSRFRPKVYGLDQYRRLMLEEAPYKAFPHMDKTPTDLNALTDYIAKMAIECVKVAAQVILKLAEDYRVEPDTTGSGCSREVWSHQTVLVFVPGAAELTDLDEEIKRHLDYSSSYGKSGKYIKHPDKNFRRRTSIYWLHSQFPNQMEGFDSPFESTQDFRVLLATNIAETGITIPSVSAVVDLGLERTSHYEARLCMKQLVLAICSKASVIQRKGRTGRTCDGINIRLFSREMYDHMKDFTPPGTERQDATKLALRAAQVAPKLPRNQLYCGARISRGNNRIDRVSYFDDRCKQWVVHHEGEGGGGIHLLDSDDVTVMHPLEASPLDLIDLLATTPTTTQIEAAFADLEQLGCTRDGEITAMGAYSLRLPLDVQAAKLVFLAHTAFGCTLDGILIAAAMAVLDSHGDCVKNPRVLRDEDVRMDELRMTMHAHQRRMELNTYHKENIWLESEPMALAHLLVKVLEENPRLSAKQAILSTHSKPSKNQQPFSYMVQKKSWAEFIDMAAKIADCLTGMVVPRHYREDMYVETTSCDETQELDSFYQLLNNETQFADSARLDLSTFKIKTEPKRLVALIGCATGSKFLMYGAGKNDMDTFLNTETEVVAWTHEQDDVAKPKLKMDPARTIRINVMTCEVGLGDGSKVPKSELRDQDLAKFFANVLAGTMYERDLGMMSLMKDHFMMPENVKGNLVQFPPFDGSRMGRQSRVFLEVVLRLRLQHAWNSSFCFFNSSGDVKYCISQAQHERPIKVKWNYVFPNQNQQHFEASAEIRACASTMQHSPECGSVKWAVASSARNKRFGAADSITMQGITVLQESSALLWILCGRPFPKGVKLITDRNEAKKHHVWGAMFHGEFQYVSEPARLDKVNRFRDLWGQVCDRKFHSQAGGVIELKKAQYITEYIGPSLQLVNRRNRDDIITDKDTIDLVHREMPEVVGQELHMIHPELLRELQDAVSDLLTDTRPPKQPLKVSQSMYVGAVGALKLVA